MASSICSARRAWWTSSLGGDERRDSTPHSRPGWQARRRPGRRRSGSEPDQSQKTGSRPRSRACPVRRRSPGEAATTAARKRRASAVACGHRQPRLRRRRAYPREHEGRCRAAPHERPAPRLYERGPVVNPRASAGRSVAARGGRPTAWTPAELRPDVGCWRPLWTAGGLVVVWSGAHVSIASSSSRTRCYRGSLRRRMSKKDCQAVRREMAPAGAKGLNGWLRVSMYQIASVSLRASSICATFAPRWRPRRRLVRW